MWDTPLISDLNYCFYFLDSWESKDVRKMKRFKCGHSFTKDWQKMVMNTAEVIHYQRCFQGDQLPADLFSLYPGQIISLQVTSRMRD